MVILYPSIKALRIFVGVNTFLFLLSFIQLKTTNHYLYTLCKNQSVLLFFLSSNTTYTVFLLRNILLLYFVHLHTRHKPRSGKHIKMSVLNKQSMLYILSSTMVETLTFPVLLLTTNCCSDTVSYAMDTMFFIPWSFLFEIIFDFWHYWCHRTMHMYSNLYRYIHKQHHQGIYVNVLTTYKQDVFDILLSNSLPFILTCLIMSMFSLSPSLWQIHLMLMYKEFVEISGHCGKVLYPTSCFPQCIWIPRLFKIELYAEDHHLHHIYYNKNFAKRFSLWDKCFGTYKSYVDIH